MTTHFPQVHEIEAMDFDGRTEWPILLRETLCDNECSGGLMWVRSWRVARQLLIDAGFVYRPNSGVWVRSAS